MCWKDTKTLGIAVDMGFYLLCSLSFQLDVLISRACNSKCFGVYSTYLIFFRIWFTLEMSRFEFHRDHRSFRNPIMAVKNYLSLSTKQTHEEQNIRRTIPSSQHNENMIRIKWPRIKKRTEETVLSWGQHRKIGNSKNGISFFSIKHRHCRWVLTF